MPNIDQRALDAFKGLHPDNAQIQALTLDAVLENTRGIPLDWSSLGNSASSQQRAGVDLTPCQMAIGFVIFDVLCLAVGAIGLRGGVSGSTVEAIASAAAPVMSKIETIVADMARAGATTVDYASGTFQILSAIYSGGCLGAVFSAFTSSLSWWTMILYGITGTATIVALFATDGVAFIAEVAILLATFGFFATDVAGAVAACSLPVPTTVADGTRVRDESTQAIYLAIDGVIRNIPLDQTFKDLFAVGTTVTNFPNVQGFVAGPAITDGAALIQAEGTATIYLLLEGGKRPINSMDIFNRYSFNMAAVRPLAQSDVDAMPTGAPVP